MAHAQYYRAKVMVCLSSKHMKKMRHGIIIHLWNVIFRVLTRILKIGVKCCRPEIVGVLPYFSIETFQKVGVRNEKLE